MLSDISDVIAEVTSVVNADAYNRVALKELSEDALVYLIGLGTREFQEAHKLTVDSLCGPMTRSVIESLVGGIEPVEAVVPSAVEVPESAFPTLLSRDVVKRTYGDFEYKANPAQKGGIIIEKKWSYANIVKVDLHIGRHVWLNKKVAVGFADLFRAACAAGGYVPERVGSWVPRHMMWNPTKPLSRHSWGIAVDFDARLNGYGKTDTMLRKHMGFVETFEQAGWAWGGRWRTPDDMHMEYSGVWK